MANAERVDEAVERDFAASFDRLEQVLDRFFAEALFFREPILERQARVALCKGENVSGPHDAAFVVEQLDLLLAEALDVERIARDEMLQALLDLRRADEPAGAAPHHVGAPGALVRLAHRLAAASRA